jgi:hypothetical protein
MSVLPTIENLKITVKVTRIPGVSRDMDNACEEKSLVMNRGLDTGYVNFRSLPNTQTARNLSNVLTIEEAQVMTI